MKSIALSIALFAVGCTTADVGTVESRPTTFDRLQERPHFMLWDADVESTAVIKVRDGDEMVPFQARLSLSSGFLTVAANPEGAIVVDELSLWYGHVKVGTGMPPLGVHLANVHIYQGEPAVCDHVDWAVDDDSCEATSDSPLMFEGSLQVTDDMYMPIGPRPIGAMGVDMFFFHEPTDAGDEVLTAEIRALAPGSLLTHKNLFELADLTLTGVGHEMVLLDD